MKDTDVQKKSLRCMKEFALPEILVIIEKCRLHVNASHLARRIKKVNSLPRTMQAKK